ncbi:MULTISPECIES: NAD(P)-dependent oxidoreductase [unclassified Erysipelothrix]|uniref:NAD(P)-dependent oxidoreductase n=1 Tax=unclassified Erysipelothrix TaxID=2624170 RepID=UPI00137719BD|nr:MULTISPECIES: NAD(P)-dependent oxidoreductase [unclassified Erysipelothrix]MBK2401869.1 NAD(P)-dependent oxidoreductase [Erysipelothrix sp. strain 2 (EsS2-6-Brazil)]MBK2403991.1 NAD(P)-dependent oxidoreductase [Erysipelothrix sp. strain 2 (EsS2-7-Brazil)]NBA00957.1 NAD-binding protein [Erysipelothrix rhusiopathiae]
MKKVAWIGTGVMGKPMALHLAQAGYAVSAYNRTFSKAKAMEPSATACQTIEAVVQDADVVFAIVGYPNDVKDVFEEVMKHAKPGCLLVDMTTSSPSLAKSLADDAEKHGYRMLDAPVTGGDLGAINATLSIMVGGDHADFESVLPLLKVMGKTINYMGTHGNGQHAKLANQTAIAGALAGTAEALHYAHHHQIDMTTMLNVITGGSAASWQAANNGPKMISKDFEPGFYLKHFLKDLKLVMDEKDDLYLPIVESVCKIYQTLSEHGYDEMGTQAIIDYYINQLS